MKVYTRTGDGGTTSLVGGARVSKSSARLEAYGTVDELNAHIAVVLACQGVPPEQADVLGKVQHRLFNLGSELATEPESKWQPKGIEEADVEMLEKAIDSIEERLPRHNRFILPGGSMASAQTHVARTVARRAERRMVAMVEGGMPVSAHAMRFINRLSDYLFVLSRMVNIFDNKEEIFWEID